MTRTARVVLLRRNPVGDVAPEDFEVVEGALPPLEDGQALVRNRWMSIDPYMRLTLGSQAGYLAAAEPGDTLRGAAIGVVEESRDPALPVGSMVRSQMGWRSRFVAAAADLAIVDPDVPGVWHLGILGLTGVTAWLGIERVLAPAAGETVLVSGASGAVGSIACQLAKRRGARVLASAGTEAKIAWLIDEIGVDAAFNHREQSLDAFLEREAPGGVDHYFDNVGGPMLEASLRHMKPYGRIGLCGAMSQYQSGDYRAGPADFFTVIEKSLELRGFNAFLLGPDETAAIVRALADWARAGTLKPLATVIDGLDEAPRAFARLFGEGFQGKAIVAIGD